MTRANCNTTPACRDTEAIASGWRILTAVLLMAVISPAPGCKSVAVNNVGDRIVPSNNRDWSPEFSKLSTARFDEDEVTVTNIRNCSYVTDTDFVIDHYDRKFNLDDVQSVDFIVVPFQGMEIIAHTMLSFGFKDGTYLCISAEIRTEKGEEYSPMLGISRQFELTYVVADERDLIRLRTPHREADVYLYPTNATPAQARGLLVDILGRVNKLALSPEFYDTFSNNCTTNIVRHVNQLKPNQVPLTWQVLLPGFSAQYAYDLGLLDRTLPFEELKSIAFVNDLVEEHYDSADFSRAIRRRRDRILEREKATRPPVDPQQQPSFFRNLTPLADQLTALLGEPRQTARRSPSRMNATR